MRRLRRRPLLGGMQTVTRCRCDTILIMGIIIIVTARSPFITSSTPNNPPPPPSHHHPDALHSQAKSGRAIIRTGQDLTFRSLILINVFDKKKPRNIIKYPNTLFCFFHGVRWGGGAIQFQWFYQ